MNLTMPQMNTTNASVMTIWSNILIRSWVFVKIFWIELPAADAVTGTITAAKSVAAVMCLVYPNKNIWALFMRENSKLVGDSGCPYVEAACANAKVLLEEGDKSEKTCHDCHADDAPEEE